MWVANSMAASSGRYGSGSKLFLGLIQVPIIGRLTFADLAICRDLTFDTVVPMAQEVFR